MVLNGKIYGNFGSKRNFYILTVPYQLTKLKLSMPKENTSGVSVQKAGTMKLI